MDEKEMKFLEEHIPEMAQAATAQAYWAALASGCKVLIADGGKLIEVSPDGTTKVIDTIDSPVLVNPGQKLELL